MDWNSELKNRLDGPLRAIASDVAHEIPGVKAHSYVRHYSGAGGSDFEAVVSCILTDVDEPDALDLVIRIEGISATPRIVTADVCWGHPSGFVELELFPEPVELSERSLSDLVNALSSLKAALVAALVRRRRQDA